MQKQIYLMGEIGINLIFENVSGSFGPVFTECALGIDADKGFESHYPYSLIRVFAMLDLSTRTKDWRLCT